MLGRPCCGMGSTMEQSTGTNMHSGGLYLGEGVVLCCLLAFLPMSRKKKLSKKKELFCRSCYIHMCVVRGKTMLHAGLGSNGETRGGGCGEQGMMLIYLQPAAGLHVSPEIRQKQSSLPPQPSPPAGPILESSCCNKGHGSCFGASKSQRGWGWEFLGCHNFMLLRL